MILCHICQTHVGDKVSLETLESEYKERFGPFDYGHDNLESLLRDMPESVKVIIDSSINFRNSCYNKFFSLLSSQMIKESGMYDCMEYGCGHMR